MGIPTTKIEMDAVGGAMPESRITGKVDRLSAPPPRTTIDDMGVFRDGITEGAAPQPSMIDLGGAIQLADQKTMNEIRAEVPYREPREEPKVKRIDPVAWLRDELQNGPVASLDIHERAKKSRITHPRLLAAAKELKVVKSNGAPGKPWIWTLPRSKPKRQEVVSQAPGEIPEINPQSPAKAKQNLIVLPDFEIDDIQECEISLGEAETKLRRFADILNGRRNLERSSHLRCSMCGSTIQEGRWAGRIYVQQSDHTYRDLMWCSENCYHLDRFNHPEKFQPEHYPGQFLTSRT